MADGYSQIYGNSPLIVLRVRRNGQMVDSTDCTYRHHSNSLLWLIAAAKKQTTKSISYGSNRSKYYNVLDCCRGIHLFHDSGSKGRKAQNSAALTCNVTTHEKFAPRHSPRMSEGRFFMSEGRTGMSAYPRSRSVSVSNMATNLSPMMSAAFSASTRCEM